MTILPQIEQQLREAAERHAELGTERIEDPLLTSPRVHARGLVLACVKRARTRTGTFAGIAAVVVIAALGFALAGGDGARQFDVAAAVYRAIAPGPGVRYVVTEEETFGRYRSRSRVQRWSTRDPARERVVVREHRNGDRERLWLGESAVNLAGTSWDWSSNQPGVLRRIDPTAVLKDELEAVQAAYRSGLLRLIGKTALGGREAYRMRPLHPRAKAGEAPNELLVDAKTFIPLEAIDYGRDRRGRLRPVFVMHYRTFEQLPATPANLAKLDMAPHPGARILPATRSGGGPAKR